MFIYQAYIFFLAKPTHALVNNLKGYKKNIPVILFRHKFGFAHEEYEKNYIIFFPQHGYTQNQLFDGHKSKIILH